MNPRRRIFTLLAVLLLSALGYFYLSNRYTLSSFLGDDLMKTQPRGVADDHPHLELLRRKNVLLSHQFGTPTWLDTRTTLTKVRSTWRALTPLVEWLADHVGPADSGIPTEPE